MRRVTTLLLLATKFAFFLLWLLMQRKRIGMTQ